MGTVLYSVLHFLVDFLCAFGMFRFFTGGADAAVNILVYNFCAFALQMPMGAAMDCFGEKKSRMPALCASAGVVLTVLGMFTHPAILGLGNAAFHVGGGIDVIREDQRSGKSGRLLGIFVAPGALGLFLGGQLSGDISIWLPVLFALLGIGALFRFPAPEIPSPPKEIPGSVLPCLCCFVVVILRSYIGLSVAFSWKTGFLPGLIAVCAVVLGKIAGGFAAARCGSRRTAVITLLLASLCYLWGDVPVAGLLALFFFNMTMPLTLYQLWLRWPGLPGTAFGVLTFGLFLGFLPVSLDWQIPLGGTMGSLLSLVLLLPVVWRDRQ